MSKSTFPLTLQSDQRCAHLCVCYGLPYGSLPSPCVRAPLPAHDKEMHGNWHQAIWHVFVCGECRVRNSISKVLMKSLPPSFLEEQLCLETPPFFLPITSTMYKLKASQNTTPPFLVSSLPFLFTLLSQSQVYLRVILPPTFCLQFSPCSSMHRALV